LAPELGAKRIELLSEMVPGLRVLGHVHNPANATSSLVKRAYRASAESLKIGLRDFEVRGAEDLPGVFATMGKSQVQAVIVSSDTLFQAHAGQIAALASRHRLPMVGSPEYADAGAILGYGAVDAEMYRRGAYFIDRILNGAKPAELPVEQPTRFALTVNLRTARALGITVPQSLLLRADRVIE
jgi:putative tryptophan/tyrosine transport system substrate-binding protein